MEGRGGTGFEVTELVEASGHVCVVVEEAEELVLELRELLVGGEAGVVFEIVVQEMDGFRLEECAQLGVLVDDISEVHFIDIGVEGAVSESGPEEHPGENGESLEANGEVPELVEEE